MTVSTKILNRLNTYYSVIVSDILPGFMDGLSNTHLLDEFAVFTSAKNYLTLLNDAGSNSNYLSELPVIKISEALTVPHAESSQTTEITHILIDNIAYELNEQSCCIHRL